MMTALDHAADLAYARTRSHRARVARSLDALTGLPGTWAVSWSGGKDSGVCVDLAGRVWDQGVVIVSDNQADSREIARLVQEMAGRHPHLSFHVRESLPDDEHDRSDLRRLLDELGIDGQVLGLRANESGYRRRIARTTIGRDDRRYRSATTWGSRLVLCPIVDWSLDDVWAYIHSRRLPYHRVYREHGRRARSPHAPWREHR